MSVSRWKLVSEWTERARIFSGISFHVSRYFYVFTHFSHSHETQFIFFLLFASVVAADWLFMSRSHRWFVWSERCQQKVCRGSGVWLGDSACEWEARTEIRHIWVGYVVVGHWFVDRDIEWNWSMFRVQASDLRRTNRSIRSALLIAPSKNHRRDWSIVVRRCLSCSQHLRSERCSIDRDATFRIAE